MLAHGLVKCVGSQGKGGTYLTNACCWSLPCSRGNYVIVGIKLAIAYSVNSKIPVKMHPDRIHRHSLHPDAGISKEPKVLVATKKMHYTFVELQVHLRRLGAGM
jgi:hypothetical protein